MQFWCASHPAKTAGFQDISAAALLMAAQTSASRLSGFAVLLQDRQLFERLSSARKRVSTHRGLLAVLSASSQSAVTRVIVHSIKVAGQHYHDGPAGAGLGPGEHPSRADQDKGEQNCHMDA